MTMTGTTKKILAMTKEFFLETYNYKYNAWLPCEIIEKLDDKIVKARCYVFNKGIAEDGTKTLMLEKTFDTCCFWPHIRTKNTQENAY